MSLDRLARLVVSLLFAALQAGACASATRARVPGESDYLRTARALGDTTVVLGDVGARVDAYLRAVSRFGFSGSVLVADSSGIIVHNGYGSANRATGQAMIPATIADMGSITKVFTGAAILLLEHEGKLAVTDSIGKYFGNVPPEKAGITLHHLLTHSSGIVSDVADDYDPVPRDSAVRLALEQPLVATPGQRFSYSNVGFSMLAAIIESVTGTPYEEHMRRRVFEPSGMRFTGYHNPRWDTRIVTRTYTLPLEHGPAHERLQANGGPFWNLMGNGGILTTTGDLYRFERAYARGTVIPPRVREKQLAPHLVRDSTLAHGYDWWIERDTLGEVNYNHGGDAPAYGLNADYRRYPADGGTIILLANSRHNGASTRRFIVPAIRRLMRNAQTPTVPPVIASARGDLERYAGRFVLDSMSSFVVTIEGDHLAIGAEGQAAVDALTFFRAQTSLDNRRAFNVRTERLFSLLANGPLDTVARLVNDSALARRLRTEWVTVVRERGTLEGVRVLGTGRLDRGQFLTTTRLYFPSDSVTVRFTWATGRPALNSEDGTLRRFVAFIPYSPIEVAHVSYYWWRERGDTFLTYDLLTSQTLRASFAAAADSAPTVTFHLPNGDLVARRADRSP